MAWTDSAAAVRKRGLDADDIVWARAKHEAGVPVSAIARMMRANVVDVAASLPSRGARPAPAAAAPKVVAAPAPHTLSSGNVMVRIATEIALHYGVTVDDLRGSSSVKHFAIPRQHLMWALYQVTFSNGDRRFSKQRIGAFIGGRDHTTVWHGINRHEDRNSSPSAFDLSLKRLWTAPKTEENQSGEAVFNHQPHPSNNQTVEV